MASQFTSQCHEVCLCLNEAISMGSGTKVETMVGCGWVILLCRSWLLDSAPSKIVYHYELHGIVGPCSHQNLEVGASPSKMTRVHLAAGAGNWEHVTRHMQKL